MALSLAVWLLGQRALGADLDVLLSFSRKDLEVLEKARGLRTVVKRRKERETHLDLDVDPLFVFENVDLWGEMGLGVVHVEKARVVKEQFRRQSEIGLESVQASEMPLD